MSELDELVAKLLTLAETENRDINIEAVETLRTLQVQLNAAKQEVIELKESIVTEREKVRAACATVCQIYAESAGRMAKSNFLTENGKMLHEGMWGGATNCETAILAIDLNSEN